MAGVGRQGATLIVLAAVAILALLVAIVLEPPTSIYLLVGLVVVAGVVAMLSDRSNRRGRRG